MPAPAAETHPSQDPPPGPAGAGWTWRFRLGLAGLLVTAIGAAGPAAKAALPALRLATDHPRFRRTPRGLERFEQDGIVLVRSDVETAIRRIEGRER